MQLDGGLNKYSYRNLVLLIEICQLIGEENGGTLYRIEQVLISEFSSTDRTLPAYWLRK